MCDNWGRRLPLRLAQHVRLFLYVAFGFDHFEDAGFFEIATMFGGQAVAAVANVAPLSVRIFCFAELFRRSPAVFRCLPKNCGNSVLDNTGLFTVKRKKVTFVACRTFVQYLKKLLCESLSLEKQKQTLQLFY